jgi:hypothetical protein
MLANPFFKLLKNKIKIYEILYYLFLLFIMKNKH